MNPYESPSEPPQIANTPPASRWAAALSGVLQGTLTGTKWGAIISAALAVLGGLAFVGVVAYRLMQEPNATLNLQALATGVFGLVLLTLISSVMTILAAAALGAIIGGLWRGLSYRSGDRGAVERQVANLAIHQD